jgi:predicted N-acetyltransferase YhbS
MGQFPMPVIVLARLAVSTQDQGKGIGVGMLKEASRLALLIAEHTGIRALSPHPIDADAARFCARFGFPRCVKISCCSS